MNQQIFKGMAAFMRVFNKPNVSVSHPTKDGVLSRLLDITKTGKVCWIECSNQKEFVELEQYYVSDDVLDGIALFQYNNELNKATLWIEMYNGEEFSYGDEYENQLETLMTYMVFTSDSFDDGEYGSYTFEDKDVVLNFEVEILGKGIINTNVVN